MSAFISHGFLSITRCLSHLVSELVPLPRTESQVHLPPRAITFVYGGRIVPALALVVHKAG